MTDIRPDGAHLPLLVARVVQATNPFISHFVSFYFLLLFSVLFLIFIFIWFVLVRCCRPAAWRLLRLAEPLRALRQLITGESPAALSTMVSPAALWTMVSPVTLEGLHQQCWIHGDY